MKSRGRSKRVMRMGFLAARDSRLLALGAGLFIVATPTLFTVFPTFTDWSWWIRALLLVAWGVAAVLVVYAAVRQGDQVGRLAGGKEEQRRTRATNAATLIMKRLLDPATIDLPDHYSFRLYIWDDSLNRLLPNFVGDGTDGTAEWPMGQGVTGRCWATGIYQLARGPHCSDAEFGLDEQQQARYAHLQVVAAMPVLDDHNDPVAVLTGSSEIDDGRLVAMAGQDGHSALTAAVARVLIDIVRR